MPRLITVLAFVVAAVATSVTAFATPAPAGAPAHRVASPESVARSAAPSASWRPVRIPERPRPAARALPAGTGVSVSGRLTYLSPFSPMGAYPVDWWALVSGVPQHGTVTTDADGAYSLSGIPPAAGDGELYVGVMGRVGLTWSEQQPAVYDFTTSYAAAVATPGGPWADWDEAVVRLWGDDGTSTVTAYGKVPNPGATPQAGDIRALPARYTDASINFWANEGAEFRGLFRNQLSNWLFPTDVDFSDADHGWATTGYSGTVMRTTDGGQTWDELTTSLTAHTSHLCRLDFADPAHGLVLDGGTTAANVMWRTADGGATWAGVPVEGLLTDVACGDADHAWAVGRDGTIIASTDGGASWAPQTSGTTQDLVCVAFSDASNGWAAGAAGTVLRTTDGGATWTPQDAGATSDLGFLSMPDAEHAYLTTGGSWNDPAPDVVLATGDGGATWAPTPAQPGDGWIGDLEFADADHGWAAGGGTVWRTTDGGATWQSSPLDFDCYLGSRPLGAASTTHLWVGGAGQLLESTDGGATWTATAATFDEAAAQRLTISTPYYASGGPGSKVKLRFAGFPAGWSSVLGGYSAWPATAPMSVLGTHTASGTAAQYKTATVPKTAKPGYFYLLTADHQQGPLHLEVPFQVCTLKSSRSSVARGGSIRLSGVVPVEGHLGSTPGKYKNVAIFSRTTAAAQPTVPDPRKRGWTLVKVVRSDRLGAYRTPLLRPKRSTWYVALYGGDGWYWGGYTPVVKVSVRR